MKRILKAGVGVVGALIVGAAVLHQSYQPNIDDRRYFWNGYWGDRTKGEDAFTGGEVHGWVHPRVTNPNPRDLEPDPYPPGYDGEQPPLRRWYDSKNGFR